MSFNTAGKTYSGESLVHISISQYLPPDLDASLEKLRWF
jgi:hypothetical protein